MTKGGNNKAIYLGMQDLCYTLTMFDVQAMWCLEYILGDISVPAKDSMIADWKKWVERYDFINENTIYALKLAIQV